MEKTIYIHGFNQPDYNLLPETVQKNIKKQFRVLDNVDVEKDVKKFEEILGVFLDWKNHRQIFDKMPYMRNLRVVSLPGVNVDWIGKENMAYLLQRDVMVTHTPGSNKEAVADHAWALLLASAKGIYEDVCHLQNGGWRRPNFGYNKEVTGATLGVIGLGNIGMEILKRSLGFNMKSYYFSRTRKSREIENNLNVTYCSTMAELLPICDYVVMCASLTQITEAFFGDKELKLMKKSATLINISRGRLINEAALIQALNNGEIANAALDVTTQEPLPENSELRNVKNCIITPHTAYSTENTMDQTIQQMIDNLEAALSLESTEETFPGLLSKDDLRVFCELSQNQKPVV